MHPCLRDGLGMRHDATIALIYQGKQICGINRDQAEDMGLELPQNHPYPKTQPYFSWCGRGNVAYLSSMAPGGRNALGIRQFGQVGVKSMKKRGTCCAKIGRAA